MIRKAPNTVANRLARHERRAAFNTFAAFVSLPLMFFVAAVFDPGAMGQVARAAIGLAVN